MITTNPIIKTYFQTGDFPTQTQFENFIDSAIPAKRYVALLTQESTNAPVAQVLYNTLGGTVVWTRMAQGLYRGTLIGAFPEGKTIFMPLVSAAGTLSKISYATDDAVEIITGDFLTGAGAGAPLGQSNSDDYLYNSSVSIWVYDL